MAKKLMRTPKGEAVHPWLNTADVKYDKDGVYKVALKCDNDDEANALGDKLEDLVDIRLAEETDKDSQGKYGEIFKDELPFYVEDGEVIFNLKLNKKGGGKSGKTWENTIDFFDPRGKPIPRKKLPKIGNGSILRVSFEPYTWSIPETEGRGKNKVTNLKVGVTLRIAGVQVLEFNNKVGQRSASDMGFEAEDGYDFDADDLPEVDEDAQTDAPDYDGDDDDFE